MSVPEFSYLLVSDFRDDSMMSHNVPSGSNTYLKFGMISELRVRLCLVFLLATPLQLYMSNYCPFYSNSFAAVHLVCFRRTMYKEIV